MSLILLAKLVLVTVGVAAANRSFSAYRLRRRDRTSPPDQWSDWGWRLLGIGGSIFIISVLTIQLIPGIPKPLLSGLFVFTGAGVVIAFAGCAVIGWRSLQR